MTQFLIASLMSSLAHVVQTTDNKASLSFAPTSEPPGEFGPGADYGASVPCSPTAFPYALWLPSVAEMVRDLEMHIELINFEASHFSHEADVPVKPFSNSAANTSASAITSEEVTISDFGTLIHSIVHFTSIPTTNRLSLCERGLTVAEFRHAVDDIFEVTPSAWQNN